MSFSPVWTEEAERTYRQIMTRAKKAGATRKKTAKEKASKEGGLFKQVKKCIELLLDDPRHPGLKTHSLQSLANPYDKNEKVFEAYAQPKTPAAYRVFWCYGPGKGQITLVAITSHP